MKKITIITLVMASYLFLFLTNVVAQNDELSTISPSNKIEVIDFHSTNRCMTCNAIEANTKYTLEKYFADELKSGEITFQTINIDEKENYAMAEKFEAAGTSLFLNVIKDGKETQINLTNFAFMKGKDKLTFSQELKSKIKKQLKIIN
jgi:hypothetical protein